MTAIDTRQCPTIGVLVLCRGGGTGKGTKSGNTRVKILLRGGTVAVVIAGDGAWTVKPS
ncbi:hypothetical protein [Paractinoplanes rishiriensis]|uniref:Uncharacterized protein n=1 Tax=Paractinoplanes rishiriensis TaxID=1050105 RepID=A0A919MY06_9ACTN|nr:hypothetical protein [Actinoplanes rishiriensis]GIE99563.1 hypothetical protein Ari01nite_70280 [Actinoplanes rishiriensis]